MLKVPLLSSRANFKHLVESMSLSPRGRHGENSEADGGTWDISNTFRIGYGEVDLVNTMVDGCSQLVEWEQRLEKGENIDAEVEAQLAKANK